VPTKNNILVQASKILSAIFPLYGLIHSSVGAVLRGSQGKRKWENITCKSVKWLQGAKVEDLQDASVIWKGK
jgi:hypothetical protein